MEIDPRSQGSAASGKSAEHRGPGVRHGQIRSDDGQKYNEVSDATAISHEIFQPLTETTAEDL